MNKDYINVFKVLLFYNCQNWGFFGPVPDPHYFADPDPKHWNNVPKKLVVLTYPQIMVSHSLGNYRPDSFYQTGASCRL